jgi:hypothetical protein
MKGLLDKKDRCSCRKPLTVLCVPLLIFLQAVLLADVLCRCTMCVYLVIEKHKLRAVYGCLETSCIDRPKKDAAGGIALGLPSFGHSLAS